MSDIEPALMPEQMEGLIFTLRGQRVCSVHIWRNCMVWKQK